jgi:hypothetical protein
MRPSLAICGLVLLLAGAAEAASNPIPGIGIIFKHPPGSSTAIGAPGLPAIPAGFFGPGSAPFSGVVDLQGQCSQNCGGCDDDCDGDVDDSRIDYVEDTDTGIFATALARAFLYSASPIEVAVNGVPSFFDVFVEIRGPGLVTDAPIPGSLQLPPGVTLAPGSSAVVAAGSCDVHARFTFADATTGAAVGQAIEADFPMVLQAGSLPIVRLNDGTPAGRIVLGLDGSTALPFTYASAGGGLVLQLKSLADAPVGVESASWGTVKGLFR